MSHIHKKKDTLKEREDNLRRLRERRRFNNLLNQIDIFNEEHDDKQIRVFEVPEKLTFEQFKDSHVFPYRSANKLKSIYNNFEQANLVNRMSTTDVNKLTKHYNSFNIKKNKKEYSLRTYSNARHSLIGDIFFDSDISYLLLININTRYAYAYQLGDLKVRNISNQDEYQNTYLIYYLTKGQKTIKSLMKAFKQHLANHKVNFLRFDGEKAINSKEFQNYLQKKHIRYLSTVPKSHTSLALIDRLCRTIRDIAFNLHIEHISHQHIMDLILDYYNNTRHETLTSTLFKAYPELKSKYKNGITPAIMDANPELERLFVMECKKYNNYVESKQDYDIKIGDKAQIVNENNPFKKNRTILNENTHTVTSRFGNIYELTNNFKKTYKPRFLIKPEFHSDENNRIILNPEYLLNNFLNN